MFIKTLRLEHFRNFSNASLSPSKGINVIAGANGSGKTSLLESIYCFGFGRSFRPGSFRQLIQHEREQFTLFAETLESESTHKLGFRRFVNGETTLRIDSANEPKLSNLARHVPLQLLTPESVELILGGPKNRRQYLDWGVFHVEHQFYSLWVSYSKLLKQRNSLLKQRRWHKEGKYWDQQLADIGEKIDELRQSYIERFHPYLSRLIVEFLPEYDFSFELRSGWSKQDASLADALNRLVEQDTKYGYTTAGPHKADLRILANGEDAKVLLSRGQLKLLVTALKLAQGRFFTDTTSRKCVYLVDDLTAELDRQNQAKLCSALVQSESQVFVTAISEKLTNDYFSEVANNVFHVEHGRITDK